MAVVFFLLDAMRKDYITEHNAPFLWKCAQEGIHYERVVPNFGFCERTEILTGLNPDESGNFTAIGYDPENSPFKGIHLLTLSGIIERVLFNKHNTTNRKILSKFYRYYRRIVSKFVYTFYCVGMSTYRIPFSLLPYFSLTEDQRDHRCKDAFPVKSILQLLEEKKRSYFYDSFTALNLPPNGSNENRMALALKAARRKDHSLYLIYNSLPDSYGHKYGPISPELENAVREMDDQLESFVNIYKKEVGDATFIFLGDHGMLPVIKLFDAKKVLFDLSKESGLKLKKDFIYFLDSTLLRVWFFSERAKRLLPVALKKSDKFNQYGKFIDERMAQRFHVPWGDRRYGDIIWWADNGVLIYPDFFHNSEMAYRGMHGYDPELVECQGTCIVYGPNITSRTIDVLPLKSVFDILKRLLEI